MEIRQLKTFVSVAEKGGFTRASEHLKYTQGTITHHIQALEEELRTPLFERLGKKVILTIAGENLMYYAKEILRLSQEAVESTRAQDDTAGTIRLGANESLLVYRLPSILNEFKKRYPEVHIELYPGDNRELRYKLKEGQLDLSFLFDIEKNDNDLHIQKLMLEKLVLVTKPKHRLTKKKRIITADLEGETLLLTEPGSYRDFLENRIKEEKVLCSQIDFWNIEAIKQCVMSGLGISYLSYISVKEELEKGKLVALPWIHDKDSVTTQLAYHKDKWISPSMTKLIDMINRHAEKWE